MAESKAIPKSWQRVLLGDGTSKCNKLWIAIGLQSRGYYLEWQWEPGKLTGFTQPVRFKFEPDGKWKDSKSYDEKHQAMKDVKK